MTTKDFNRCLQWIKNGDKRGMTELYNHYYEKLKFTAALEVQNEASAEDIASNVLISIFKNAANYGYIDNPNAYMYRAVVFAAINYKKQNIKYVYTELLDNVYCAYDANVELKVDFMRFLEKIPQRQREIVQLHYVYGFKITETAKFLHVSVSTVNRDLLEIRKELKKFIST